ncbi:MAG: ABC transporter permease [Candidatus Fimimorpha sp.]
MQKNKKKRICVVFFWIGFGMILWICSRWIVMQCPYEQLNKFWSNDQKSAEIRVFFPENQKVSKQMLMTAEEDMETVLEQNGISNPSERKKIWTSAYSAEGRLVAEGEKAEKMVQVIGVGGDFFFFHPFVLKSGTWFDTRKSTQSVILNEEAAWQLFGSSDIAGMELKIGAKSYLISGVIKMEKRLFQEAAGADNYQIYLSYEEFQSFLEKGVTCYEVIFPNPIQDFAVTTMKKQEIFSKAELMETTNRFSLVKRLSELPFFFEKFMHTNNIQYPFWENTARAWEGVRDIILIFQIIWIVLGVKIIGELGVMVLKSVKLIKFRNHIVQHRMQE